jgi:hypothetical protein
MNSMPRTGRGSKKVWQLPNDMSTHLLEASIRGLNLSPGWSAPEPFTECAEVADVSIHLAGFSATSPDGVLVTGSAASTICSPVARAYFELIERAAVIDCLARPRDHYRALDEDGNLVETLDHSDVFPESPEPDRWQYSRSNGIAAAPTFARAHSAARMELVERDRVLRSWFGGTAPRRLVGLRAGQRVFADSQYAVELYSFSEESTERGVSAVVGMFAFPKCDTVPFVVGTGAGTSLFTAVRRAARECVQRLGFLWGEPIPTVPPGFEPTPLYHQELYLCPSMQPRLRAWLDGRHQAGRTPAPRTSHRRYVDLTPEHLRSRIRVVKALPAGELPLTFGRPSPARAQDHESYGVHPIA